MGRASRRKRAGDGVGDAAGGTAGGARPASPIIIGGCPRSGTTLLRMMLDAHPRIACGPEFKALNLIAANCARMLQVHGPTLVDVYGLEPAVVKRTFGDQVVALLEPWRQRAGKPRIAEKTPQNVHAFELLAEMLPASPFVHVIRDGRDVARSLLRQQWRDPATGQPVPYTADLAEAARYWVRCIRDGRRLRLAEAAPRYHEVRYEELVADPEATLRSLLAFLGEGWDPAVLEFHRRGGELPPSERPSHGDDLSRPVHAGAVGRWRGEWSDAETATFQRYAGAALTELGYGDGGDGEGDGEGDGGAA